MTTWLDMATRDPGPANLRHPARLTREIAGVVWHFTAGTGSASTWLKHPENTRVSWHFTIERGGRVLQHYPLDARCSHSGGSTWRGGQNVNGRTIGVEVENLGPVNALGIEPMTEEPGVQFDPVKVYRQRCGRSESGRYLFLPPGREVAYDGNGGLWEAYDDLQIEAICALAHALATRFPALSYASSHVAHSDIRPGKSDPGPLFPWRSLHDTLTGNRERTCTV